MDYLKLLPNVSEQALRNSQRRTFGDEGLTPLQRSTLSRAVSEAVGSSVAQSGNDLVLADQIAQQAYTAVRSDVEQRTLSSLQDYLVPTANQNSLARESIERVGQAARDEQEWRESVSFGDQVGAAWDQYTGTQGIIDAIFRPGFEADPDFDYIAERKEIEEGLTLREAEYVRENAVSRAHADYLLTEVERERQANKELSARGGGMALAASLVGGVMDPVGWAAGLGVGKGLQLAGVGSRALYAAGRTPSAFGSLVAEGAVGNVALEGILDAAGRNVDATDYIAAGAFGAGFGAVLSPVAFRGARGERIKQDFDRIRRQSEEQAAHIYETANRNVGPGGTPDDIAREARRLQQAEIERSYQTRLADVPEEDRMWDFQPVTEDRLRAVEDSVAEGIETARLRMQEDGAAIEAALQRGDPDAELRAREDLAESQRMYREAARGSSAQDVLRQAAPEPLIRTPEGHTAASQRYGTDAIPDDRVAERELLNELFVRAERFNANNPVDESRLQDLLGRLGNLTPRLASTAQQLLRSNHPVAKFWASTMLENTTGAGGRRASAAIDKAMSERIYMGDFEPVVKTYKMWRVRNGGSAVKDAWGTNHWQRFNREVALEREARQLDPENGRYSNDPYVRQAADYLDNGYQRMADEQRFAGVPGSDNIPASSRGYAPRRFRPEWLAKSTNAQRRAMERHLTGQLTELYTDPVFARNLAKQYLEHARASASGLREIPVDLRSDSAAPLIREVLTKMGRSADEIDEQVRILTRGGPSYTRSRINLNLTREIIDPESGESFRLIDAFETDQAKLYQQYARRASGEVALAKRGVLGKAGLDTIRQSLAYGADGTANDPATIQAFEQTAAEFLGTPYGSALKPLDDLRLLTATSRLGGMAFTQFAEYANGVAALGMGRTMAAIRDIPRILGDVRAGRSNPVLESIELVGGRIGEDYRVIMPYEDIDTIQIYGREKLGRFSRIVRGVSNAFPHVNGWHYVHAAQARGMSEQIVHKAIRAIRTGNEGNPTQARALRDMGFSEDLQARIREDLGRVAEFDGDGRLVALDITKGQDQQAMHEFVQAVHRGSKQIIQGEFVGERGFWAHDGLLRILTQFRTFSLVSMEKQWTRQAAVHGSMRAFGLLLGAMSFALPIHLARLQINALGRDDREEYLEEQMNPAIMGRSLLNYVSLSGMASDALDAGAAVGTMFEGATGVDLPLDATNVRGRVGEIDALVPGLGWSTSVMRAATGGDVVGLLKTLPGGNLPLTTPLLNAIKPAEEKAESNF